MKAQLIITTTIIVLGGIIVCFSNGCFVRVPDPQDSVECFRKYSSNTKWYFATRIGLPLPINGFRDLSRNPVQAILMTESDETYCYEEYTPHRGLKSWSGRDDYERIESVSLPIFTVERPDYISVCGFVGNRKFRVHTKKGRADQSEQRFQQCMRIAEMAYTNLVQINKTKLPNKAMDGDKK